MVNHLVLAICHFQLRKKWCLQNFYSIKKLMMLLKLWHCWLIWDLFAGFKTVGLCSLWFVKYVFSTEIDSWKFQLELWNMNHELLNWTLQSIYRVFRPHVTFKLLYGFGTVHASIFMSFLILPQRWVSRLNQILQLTK